MHMMLSIMLCIVDNDSKHIHTHILIHINTFTIIVLQRALPYFCITFCIKGENTVYLRKTSNNFVTHVIISNTYII